MLPPPSSDASLIKGENVFRELIQKENEAIDSSDLTDMDDCTICLFIPYQKFSNMPNNEINRIKDEASLEALQEGLFYYMAQ